MSLDWAACRAQLEAGRDCALITLLTQDGSAPRGPGAKRLITLDGVFGTVGGGALETRAIEVGRQVIADGRSRLLHLRLTEGEIDSVDMACGGSVTLLVEAVSALEEQNRNHFRRLEAYRAGSVASTCLTALESRPDRLEVGRAVMIGDGTVKGERPSWALSAAPLSPGESYCLRTMGVNRLLLLETVCPPLHLYICGGGHVGLKTAELATFWGQRVTVMDDRIEFAAPERFPGAQVLCCPGYEALFCECELGRSDCVVIVTRGHRYDKKVLEQVLYTDAGYIGMIGSRSKVEKTMKELSEAGWAKQDLSRVHAPIGWDIGAETPAEIAVSIISQIIQEMRNR